MIQGIAIDIRMVREALVLVGAVLAGAAVALAAATVRISPASRPGKHLADYMGGGEEEPEDRRLFVGPDAVILSSLGLPGDSRYLTYIRGGAFAIPAVAMLALGYPTVVSLGAGALAFVLVDSFLLSRWKKFQTELERELPTFVSRLAGTLQVTASPVKAVEEVADTLEEGSPLRVWLERLIVGSRTEGSMFFREAREAASAISPSLGLVVFEIGRMTETGGGGFVEAFTTTAENLSAILEARAVAASKAEAARNAVHMMLAIIAGILLMMLSSPNIRKGFANPTVQMISLLALGAMAYGYTFLNNMINESVE